MATYIGYYRRHPDFWREDGERAREAGRAVPDEKYREKVAGLRDKLPPTIKLIGSYASISTDRDRSHPSVWICECDDPAELAFVNNYYLGYLVFEWVPVIAVGTSSKETEAVIRAAQERGS